MLIYEVPLDDVDVGLWCAMSAARIIELNIFFPPEAINLHRYVTLFLHLVYFFCFKAHLVDI
jgi:hypothetical protein